MGFLSSIKARFAEINRRPEWQQITKRLKQLAGLTIAGIIIYQLFQIGWGEVLRSLPIHPLFYLIFFLLFLSLPTAELLIYRRFWRLKHTDLFRTFLAKRVYNEEVMGYSGEVYLVIWAKSRTGKTAMEITRVVRDNNILSAACSYIMVAGLLFFLVWADVLRPAELVSIPDRLTILIGFLVAALLIFLAWKFRSRLYSMGLKNSAVVFSLYSGRFVIHHALLVVQWMVVIPDVPVYTWLIFVAVIIVVNRLPFLPSKDLIFVWAGIELSGMLNIAAAPVAGMLLVSSAMNKLMNASLYFYVTSFAKDSFEKPKPDEKSLNQK